MSENYSNQLTKGTNMHSDSVEEAGSDAASKETIMEKGDEDRIIFNSCGVILKETRKDKKQLDNTIKHRYMGRASSIMEKRLHRPQEKSNVSDDKADGTAALVKPLTNEEDVNEHSYKVDNDKILMKLPVRCTVILKPYYY
ncbi:unnamed protein product [Leptidea sinapis]|uniref:Uncharacterized protein n=1 Tax=Leptidea sinapis TaxID=189913 RepID=A0A5E4R6C9_9NEOP|nr:unnamed protein product [Leptidea sinapis]